jgi:HAD superfamily hydrolase (TIGR01509 family)
MDAVLWDMDGVLVDSEPLWTVAEIELAALLGGTWNDEIKALVVGTRLDVAVPAILRFFGVPDTPERVAETSAWLLDRMVQLFTAQLAMMTGAEELLVSVHAEGVPMALVSSSFRVLVDAVLAQGVGPFAVTLAGDEVGRAKPDPEPYLMAAQLLGADPSRCVVIEDSPAGVAAGEAAGCALVAVPGVAGVAFANAPRRLVVPSLAGVSVGDLRALV